MALFASLHRRKNELSTWNKCFYFFHSNSGFPINKMLPFLLLRHFSTFSAIFSTLLHLLKSRAIGVKESLFVPFLSPFPKDPRTRTHTKKSVFCILHDSQKCIGIHTDINCRKIIFGLLFSGFQKVPKSSGMF